MANNDPFCGWTYDVSDEIPQKRLICAKCKRPQTVCLCRSFPASPVSIANSVIVLQHPLEENRSLATVPLLKACLPSNKLTVIRDNSFQPSHFADFEDILRSRNTVLVYPSKNAVQLLTLERNDPKNLVFLDGTWRQVKQMYGHSYCLHHLKKVVIDIGERSEYIIRKQPMKKGLSTLESVAHSLAYFEDDPSIKEVLLQPLRLLCQHQIDHGGDPVRYSDDSEDEQEDLNH